MPLNMASDEEDLDLEALRAAALKSLKSKSIGGEITTQVPEPQWSAVGGRRGMGKPFRGMQIGRGRSPRKMFGMPRGNGYKGRGGATMFGWVDPQQLINRSNLISIIPMNSDTQPIFTPLQSSAQTSDLQTRTSQAQPDSTGSLEEKSSVPTKFSRFEHSDSEESEEEDVDESKETPKEAAVEAEEPDPDVILMQDEDSLGKLLDEFELELKDEAIEKPTETKKAPPPAPPAKKPTEHRPVSPVMARRVSRSPSPRWIRRSPSPELRRRLSPRPRKHYSPIRRSRSRSLSPGLRRRSPPRRLIYSRRSPTPERRRRSPLPLRYTPPRKMSDSPPGYLPIRGARKRSPSPLPKLRRRSPSPCNRMRSKSPRSPHSPRPKLRKIPLRRSKSPCPRPLRRSESPRSRSLSPKSHSSSRSLTLSPSPPPRAMEPMRVVAPLGVSTSRRNYPACDPLHAKISREPTQETKETPKKGNKSSSTKVSKVRKQKSPKIVDTIETVKLSPVLEARRRKFESSAPIQVDNKKIRLGQKHNAPVVSEPARSISPKLAEPVLATLKSEPPEKKRKQDSSVSRAIKEERQAVASSEEQKSDDLRAELRRRKAERLHKAGNVHQNVPTRLVQSALHGVVGKSAGLQRREKAGVNTGVTVTSVSTKEHKEQSKKLDVKSSRTERRRVMVVHKREDSPDIHNTRNTAVLSLDKGEGETSKGPVHSRLGSAALVMQVASSHRSGSKNKASKVQAAEASSSGNAFDDTVEHSHKKKEKRKFRLKRSKQRSVSSSPARKVYYYALYGH